MSIRHKTIGVGTALALTTAVSVVPVATAQAAPSPSASAAVAAAPLPADTVQPVTGTLADGTEFTGTISDLSTQVVDGVLMLTGTVNGTGIPVDGTTFATPIQTAQVNDGCSILALDLGPLHLDLLGLVIDLEPVVLDITAVPGAGNLLGNLLCAVAGLLDRGGPLQGITALLNRLLTGLGLG